MTDSDRRTVETWASLAGDTRRRADRADADERETAWAEAERLESLINFYKASLAG